MYVLGNEDTFLRILSAGLDPVQSHFETSLSFSPRYIQPKTDTYRPYPIPVQLIAPGSLQLSFQVCCA